LDLLGEDHPEVEKAKLAKTKADEEAEKQFKAWRDGQPIEQKIKWAQKQVANKQRWVDSVHEKCSKLEDKIAALERELEALNPTGARAHQQLAEAEQFLDTAMAQLAQALPQAREETGAAPASDPISAMVKLVATMQEGGTAHVPKDVHGYAQLQALVATLRSAMPGLEALAAAPPPAPAPPTPTADREEGAEEGREEADPHAVKPSKRQRGEDKGASDTIEVDEEGGSGDSSGQPSAGRGAKGGGSSASSQAPA
jgi:hypothetical protein